jgi:hypothetical protein
MGTAVAVVAHTPEARAASINKHFDEIHKLGERWDITGSKRGPS